MGWGGGKLLCLYCILSALGVGWRGGGGGVVTVVIRYDRLVAFGDGIGGGGGGGVKELSLSLFDIIGFCLFVCFLFCFVLVGRGRGAVVICRYSTLAPTGGGAVIVVV